MYFKTLVLVLIILAAENSVWCQKIAEDAPSKNLSFIVADLSGQLHFEKNSDEALTPASVTKLFTTYAALKILGVDYSFKTQVYRRIDQGKVEIAVVGNGDPVFNSESLYVLLTQLKVRGISRIDLMTLDDSNFIEQFSNKGDRAYQSGTSALSINNNSEEIFACKPIQNTTFKNCTSSYKSTSDTRDYFKKFLDRIAKNLNIQINKFEFNSIANNKDKYTLLYQHYSPPLPKIIFDLNHFSTNMIAEQLVFAIGESGGKFSHAKGVARIKELMKEDLGQIIEIVDGSGLSTKNKISAKQISLLLKKVIDDQLISPEFVTSMSIANISGTLKRRDTLNRQLLFRGKTGMLDGVSSIAGYLTAKSGRKLIFVSLQNGAIDVNKAKSWEESVINKFWELY